MELCPSYFTLPIETESFEALLLLLDPVYGPINKFISQGRL